MGRVTYEVYASTWPDMTDVEGFADRMNSLPKYVASRTLEDATWNNTTVIRENVPEAIAAPKQDEGQSLLLSGTTTFATGVVALHYEPAPA
jgi:dihydrofolate reductase